MRLSAISVSDHYPHHSRSVPDLYGELLGQALLADELAYNTFFVAEHHFHEYGVVPNPAVLLSGIAQRTKHIRLGPAISVLPFRDPVLVAEDYAMLDVLSGGRLVLGVGSGYLKHEFAGFGVKAEEKRDRFDENLWVVERLLRGERVLHVGRYATVHDVRLNIVPLQKDLAVYVASLRKEGAYDIGFQGRRLMCVPYATLDRFDEIGGLMTEFRRGRGDAGFANTSDDATAVALHTCVAATDGEARDRAAIAFDRYVSTRLYANRAGYDDVIRSGLALFGSVDTVVEKMLRLKSMGVDHVMCMFNFGLMSDAEVRRSMKVMMEEVMPRVAATSAKPAPRIRAVGSR